MYKADGPTSPRTPLDLLPAEASASHDSFALLDGNLLSFVTLMSPNLHCGTDFERTGVSVQPWTRWTRWKLPENSVTLYSNRCRPTDTIHPGALVVGGHEVWQLPLLQ